MASLARKHFDEKPKSTSYFYLFFVKSLKIKLPLEIVTKWEIYIIIVAKKKKKCEKKLYIVKKQLFLRGSCRCCGRQQRRRRVCPHRDVWEVLGDSHYRFKSSLLAKRALCIYLHALNINILRMQQWPIYFSAQARERWGGGGSINIYMRNAKK